MSNGATDRFVVSGLKAEGLKAGQKIEQHVGGEANLGGGDRQHGRLPLRLGVEPSDHVMNVVGGSDALGEPEGFRARVSRTEKVGVVIQAANHSRIGPAQCSFRKQLQRFNVWLKGWEALFHHLGTAR